MLPLDHRAQGSRSVVGAVQPEPCEDIVVCLDGEDHCDNRSGVIERAVGGGGGGGGGGEIERRNSHIL